MFIRGLNAIYAQARGVEAAQAKPFALFCVCLFEMLHDHHHTEENYVFPFMDAKLGTVAMEHNKEQHQAFLGGLEEVDEYMKVVQAGSEVYRGEKVVEMLDRFADELVLHLHEEIDTLEASKMRAAIPEKDLLDLNARVMKHIRSEASLTTKFPFSLICHETASAPYFPPIPAPVLWTAKNVLYHVHSDAWAFGPCDKHGVLKPGLGNDP
uniref:Hemerythrin-like domain-containing protein n=1 Tax=Mycena chlorophos TaxID=658473 RepID=A0ABQ0LY30_MYCCL|nr:predicted protein [Mycena chlorophos]